MSIEAIHLYVKGTPKAQPRAKARRVGGFVQMYTPNTAKEWKDAIKKAVNMYPIKSPVDAPVRVKIDFYMPYVGKHYLKRKSGNVLRTHVPFWHTSKPDIDNLTKAVYDSLSDAGVWTDDNLVCVSESSKMYSQMPHAEITIMPLAGKNDK